VRFRLPCLLYGGRAVEVFELYIYCIVRLSFVVDFVGVEVLPNEVFGLGKDSLEGYRDLGCLASVDVAVVDCEVDYDYPLNLDFLAHCDWLFDDFVNGHQHGAVGECCITHSLRVNGAEASVKPSMPTEVTMATPKASFFIPNIFMSMPQVDVMKVISLSRTDRINAGRNLAGPVRFLCASSPPFDDRILEVLLRMKSPTSSRLILSMPSMSTMARSLPPSTSTRQLTSTVL
jgi:hypothetical protein